VPGTSDANAPTRPDAARLLPRAREIARLGGREARMEAFAALWWEAFAAHGTSWAGFYVDVPGEPNDRRMVLAARRPKPACSPIGIHGACGQSLTSARTLVVRDVAELGAGYIACDPRDRSELVVPCLDAAGHAWAVFDVDSHEVANFDRRDADCCAALLVAAGLSERTPEIR
jgi:putative methionine-R-sulfoxide reductase with GAF domain